MTNEPSPLDGILGGLKDGPDYVAEAMSLRVVEDALAFMEHAGMTKARLADAMHVSRAYITKLFNAPSNLTLRTVAQLALAVGAQPTLRLEPVGGHVMLTNSGFSTMNSGGGFGSVSLASDLGAIPLISCVVGASVASTDWAPLAWAMLPAGRQFSITTEEPWNYRTDSKPTLDKNVDSLRRGSVGLTPSTSTTGSTTTARSMAA